MNTRSNVPLTGDPRLSFWFSVLDKLGHSDSSTADLLAPVCKRLWKLQYSLYLIKSHCAACVPTAEAELGLSKHLCRAMSDGFIENGITAANKQPLRCWYLQSEVLCRFSTCLGDCASSKLGQNLSGQFHQKSKCEVKRLLSTTSMNSKGPSWPWVEGIHLGTEFFEMRRRSGIILMKIFFYCWLAN